MLTRIKNLCFAVVCAPLISGCPSGDLFPAPQPTPVPLSVKAVTPSRGPIVGGTKITITGFGFADGVTVMFGGAPCGDISLVSAQQIECVSPPHAPGQVDVVVTNSDKAVALFGSAYTYQGAPAILAVSPAAGPILGGTILTITGVGFDGAAQVALDDKACNNVVVASASQILCTTPAHIVGPVIVQVQNGDGQIGSFHNGYNYQDAVTITQVSPVSGPATGGTVVTITGTAFKSGAQVAMDGLACTGVTVLTTTSLSCTTPAHAAGPVTVAITNLDASAGNLSGAYLYNAGPTISGVSPNTGNISGGATITIVGTNFQNGATVTVGGVSCTSVSFVSPTQLTCTTPAHAIGAVAATVTNPDTQQGTLTNAYNFASGPVLSSLAPLVGPLAGGITLTLTGSGFVPGSTASVGGNNCASTTYLSSTQLACVTPAHAAGLTSVTVTNPDIQSSTLGGSFTYQGAPAIQSIYPTTGGVAGGNLVTLTGTGFLAGIQITIGGAPCGSPSLSSSTQLTCTTPSHTPGSLSVVATNPDTQTSTLVNSFTFQVGPTLASISPTAGALGGGTTVTLTGTGFQSGAAVTFGGAACASVNVVNATQVTCSSPAHAAGAVGVTVTNPDAQGATLTAAYAYQAAPTISSVTPIGGNTAGGTAVTVNGSGFLAGATITFGGATCAPTLITATQVFCTTAAHAAGAVTVLVTNPDTQSVSGVGAFTYTAGPSVASVYPSGGTMVGGATLQIFGGGFVASTSVAVGGVPCSAMSYVSTSQVNCTTPAHAAGMVSVVATNPDNQLSTMNNAYTYAAGPSLTSISPTSGSPAGGNTLTLNGSGFQFGATVSVGGNNCTGLTVVSAAQITCTVPGHVAATVSVVVTNPDTQTSTLSSSYTYVAAPTITSLSQTSGPAVGLQSITIGGTGFRAGASVSFGGAACTVVVVGSATSLSCTTPAHVAGTVNVVVTNDDAQSGTLAASYVYADAPTISSISPAGGPVAGAQVITLTGTGYVSGAGVVLGNTTVGTSTCTGVTVVSPTSITCLSPAHSAATLDITVTNADGQKGTRTSAYTYQAPPTLTGVSPATGSGAGGTTITLSGTNFRAGFTATVGGVACTSPTLTNATLATCVTPAKSAGTYDVIFSNADTQSSTLAASFTSALVPTLSSITPGLGDPAGGTVVTVTGTGFVVGDTVSLGGSSCGSVSVTGATSLTCVTSAHAAGTVHVALTGPYDTTQLFSAFTYAATPAPAISSVSPVGGTAAGGTPVTISGSGFLASPVVTFDGTPCTSVVRVSATAITCTTPAHALGASTIVVTNTDGQAGSLPNAFAYQSAPTLTSVSPVNAPLAGGGTLTLTGTGFVGGGSVSVGGTACAPVSVASATSATCVLPAKTAGIYSVTFTNADGRNDTVANAITYRPAPTVTSFSPTAGSYNGSQALTVNGANYLPGATVTLGGTPCTVTFNSSTQITCTTGAHAAGTVTAIVTNPDGQAVSPTWVYLAPPTLTSVSPTSGPSGGSNWLTIYGTNLYYPSITIGNNPCLNVSFSVGAGYVQCNSATPQHAAGVVDVTITNPDGGTATLPNSYTYAAPTITALSSGGGGIAGGTTLQIDGSNFNCGATVRFGTTVASVTANNCNGNNVSTRLNATAPAHAAGLVDISVTNYDGVAATVTNGYNYSASAAPVISTITPAGGPWGGNNVITVSGTGFAAGATVAINGLSCTSPTVNSATQMTCVVPANSTGGSFGAAVVVRNTDGQTSTASSYYYNLGPQVSAVTPSSVSVNGGQTITLTSGNCCNLSGFWNSPTVSIGGTPCTSVNLISNTTLTCVTPARPTGTTYITVTNGDGQASTLAASITYVNEPTVSSISVTSGSSAGGTVFNIAGTNFVAGMSAKLGSTACTATYASSTSVNCTTQASTQGTYDLTYTNGNNLQVTLPNAFTYIGVPVITSVSPTLGPLAGGTALTINGTGFNPVDTITVGGATCSTPTFVSATKLTCVTPAHAAGAVNVAVASGFDTGTATNAYTYTATPAPTVTSISPAGGPPGGGTAVTITGTGFGASATAKLGTTFCDGITVVSPTQITCTTLAASNGIVDVVVTNTDAQKGTLVGGFTYAGPPTLTSVSPTGGPLAGGGTLTLTGTNFLAGAAVTVGGTSCGSVNVASPTSLTCVLPAKTAGTYHVTITNTDTRSATAANAYTYSPTPTISSLSPSAGPIAGGTNITINGTNFVAGATANFGGSTCTVTYTSPSQILCTTTAHAAGAITVTVANPDTQFVTSAYTYNGAPTISAVAPNGGTPAGGNSVIITGTGFLSGATASLGGTSCASVDVTSATSLTCVAPAHSAGSGNVVVANADGQSVSLTNGYTFQVAPVVSSVSPTAGRLSGGNLLTITGTGFLSGATASVGGNGCTGLTVVSATQITCTLAAHAAGAVSAIVTNSDTQTSTLGSAYTYQAAPTLTSVSPVGGLPAGGTLLTVNGTGFLAGASVTLAGNACTGLTFVNATRVTCTTPAGSAGAADVILYNADGQSATSVGAFTYRAAPTISAISPNVGQTTGGNGVTITGTGFVAGATVSIGGSAATGVTVASATSITATTPAHAAGTVGVVVTNVDTQTGSLGASFTYSSLTTPTITSVLPVGGDIAGGTTISLGGTNFAAGATISLGGSSCGSVNVASLTSATCVTTAHASGAVTVTLVNTDAQAAAFSSFTYSAPPTAVSVSPTAGALGGGTPLLITGTGFLSGATVTIGGNPCGGVVVNSWTSISCTTTAYAAGQYDLVVTNTDSQFGTLTNGYKYQAGPSITSVSPVAGVTAGGTSLTLTGTGFLSGATATVGGVNCGTLTVVNPTTITCTTGAHAQSVVNVVVTSSDTQNATLTNGYQYTNNPVVTSVAPTYGAPAGGDTVVITGVSFASGATVTFGGTAATSVTFDSSTQLTVTTPAHLFGNVNVVVTNPDTLTGTLTNGFSYTAAPAPVVSSVSPTTGSVAGGTTLIVTGTGFASGAIAKVGSNTCTSTTFNSSTQVTCVTPAGSLGAQAVRVTNSDTQSGALGAAITYLAVPSVFSVSPPFGKLAGGDTVVITGADFATGATINLGTAPCGSLVVDSATQITCVTTAGGSAAAVGVKVTMPDQRTYTLASGFSYVRPPTVLGVIPANGPTSGGSTIAIFGTGYYSGATVTVGGGACTSPTYVGAGKLTCVTPAHAGGDVDVVVTNVDGQTGTGASSFYYGTPSYTTLATVAGAAAAIGFKEGAVTDARFQGVAGLANDGTYLYVADALDGTIRRVTLASGTTTLIAGAHGARSCSDGTGAGARFKQPGGLATDGTTLWISDTGCNVIRAMDLSSGVVMTIAGTLGAANSYQDGAVARFNRPLGLWYDGTRYLYLAEYGGNYIRVVDLNTNHTSTLAGNGSCTKADGIGTAAKFCNPAHVTGDGAYLYVTDEGSYLIRRIDISTAAVTSPSGNSNFCNYADGGGNSAHYCFPFGITMSGGNLYVTDETLAALRRVTLAGMTTGVFAGNYGNGYTDGLQATDSPQFSWSNLPPNYFAYAPLTNDGTYVYLYDPGNHALRKIAIANQFVTTLVGDPTISSQVDGTGTAARLRSAVGVATDGTTAWVLDATTIRAVTLATGATSILVGAANDASYVDANGTSARIFSGAGLAYDGGNYLYFLDECMLRRYELATGIVSTLAGQYHTCNYTAGSGTTARLNYPRGIATDGTNVYIADTLNQRVRRYGISSTAIVTIAGGFTSGHADSATGTSATLYNPVGVATDGTYVYIGEEGNDSIRRVDISSTAVTTLAGNWATGGYVDATGTSALFNSPDSLATDGTYLYIGDRDNHAIRKLALGTNVVQTLQGRPSAVIYGDYDTTLGNAYLYLPDAITLTNGRLLVATPTTLRLIQ